MYCKCIQVIKTCTNILQLETAKKYVALAYRNKYINRRDLDHINSYIQAKVTIL